MRHSKSRAKKKINGQITASINALDVFFYNYSSHLMKAGYSKDSSRCFTAYLHILGCKDGMYSIIFVAALSCRIRK